MSGLESVTRMFFAGAGAAIAVVVLLHGTGALAQTGLSSDVPSATPPTVQPRPFQSAATAPLMTAGETDAGPSLQAFARAAHGVSGLRDKYMPRITAANIAERPERASDLFEEMRARMHDTIEANGLTVENYEAMSARAAADAGFRTRVETILNGGTPAAGSPSQGQSNSSPSNPPRGSMARAQRDVDSAAAQREIGDLQRRLTQTETRLRQTQNRAVSGRAALKAQHTAELAVLRKQLAARPSEDALATSAQALAAADAEQARTSAERAALGREISHLSRSLQASLAALREIGTGLKIEKSAPARPFVRLTPKPSLFARTPTGLPRDLNAAPAGAVLQARLDTEITRNLSLRAAQTAERVALGRELTRITSDLAATGVSLSALKAALVLKPTDDPALVVMVPEVRVGDPLYDVEAPAVLQAVRPEVSPEPATVAVASLPASSPTSGAAIFPVVTRIAAENPAENPDENPDAIAAGIRAYEVKDYARAHDLWRPLAEAGQPMAQFHLGALYFEGRGVTRDLDEAQIWLARALGQGVTRARFLLGRVERGMAKAG